MPRGDRTGPRGEGPRTGRGLGDCEETRDNEVRDRRRTGRGLGAGRGRGFAVGPRDGRGGGRGGW